MMNGKSIMTKSINDVSAEKRYIIVQTQLTGEFALTKANTYEETANALKRFKAMDIPFIKIVEKDQWQKTNSKKQ